MGKYDVLYIPLLPWFIVLAFCSLFGPVVMILDNEFSLSFLIVIVVIFLILILLQLAVGRVIAELNDDGIQINYEDFIKWDEIKNWEYTMAGRFSNNSLIIQTENKKYEIRGFNQFKVLKYFKRYAYDKRINELKFIYILLFILIILSISFIWYYINK